MKTTVIKQLKSFYYSVNKKMVFATLCILSVLNVFSQSSLSSFEDGMAAPIKRLKELNNYIPNLLAYSGLKSKEDVDEEEAEGFLEIIGDFDGSVSDFNGKYVATLILDNDIIEIQDLKVRKSMYFLLQRNKIYTIRIDKEGYISKCISIYTHVSDNDKLKQPYLFTFETNLLSLDLKSHFDDDDVDFPVALISYKKDCDCFEYNKQYTNSLMNRMMTNLFFGM